MLLFASSVVVALAFSESGLLPSREPVSECGRSRPYVPLGPHPVCLWVGFDRADLLGEAHLCESLEEATWLWRGVPLESPEVADVRYCNEVHPCRPDRTGDGWRHRHMSGDTETGYTSWSSERSFAVAAAEASSETSG